MNFFGKGVISKGVNATFIVFIPKKEMREFSDFRSISVVGSLYKIISKVLSPRVRKVMDSVVSCSQGAFVRGRQITNGLVANEMVDGRKNSKKPGLVIDGLIGLWVVSLTLISRL